MVLHNTQRFFLSVKTARVARAAREARRHLRRIMYAVGFLTCTLITAGSLAGHFMTGTVA